MTDPTDPAFPVTLDNSRTTAEAWAQQIKLLGGLTKREYFAAQALRGAIEWHGYHEDPRRFSCEITAKDCIAMADALLNELNKAKDGK